MIDDDEFEERFEEFCEMTDAQGDAVLEREMAEYARWWNTLTALQRFASSGGSGITAEKILAKSQIGHVVFTFTKPETHWRQLRVYKRQ